MSADLPDFAQRIAPYRTELLAHCYRMLGSFHDAEDVVQETYLRAWRARDSYDESRASLRTWMYRIATNACLNARASDARRPLPAGFVAASEPMAPLVRSEEITWLQPLPDSALDGGDPARATVDRSTVRLAFVAALQHLSARQRAVLLLRDVLDFSAAESAQLLGTTAISVNSALRRARATMAAASPRRADVLSTTAERAVVDRYMAAFVGADVGGITRMLAEDVVMEMPPMLNWFTGRDGYERFMTWVFHTSSDWRVSPIAANGQAGFAAYRREAGTYRLHTLQVLTVSGELVSRCSVFQDDEVFAAFGLPLEC